MSAPLRLLSLCSLSAAVVACGAPPPSPRVPRADAGPDARPEDDAATDSDGGERSPETFDGAQAAADGSADLDPCPTGFVEDGAFCVMWRTAAAPDRCRLGEPQLWRSDRLSRETGLGALMIACPAEPVNRAWRRGFLNARFASPEALSKDGMPKRASSRGLRGRCRIGCNVSHMTAGQRSTSGPRRRR